MKRLRNGGVILSKEDIRLCEIFIGKQELRGHFEFLEMSEKLTEEKEPETETGPVYRRQPGPELPDYDEIDWPEPVDEFTLKDEDWLGPPASDKQLDFIDSLIGSGTNPENYKWAEGVLEHGRMSITVASKTIKRLLSEKKRRAEYRKRTLNIGREEVTGQQDSGGVPIFDDDWTQDGRSHPDV